MKALIGRIYRKHLPGYLFILPALAVMSLLILYPLYQTFFLSLYREIRFQELSFIGLGNFVEVITSDYFVKILLNTLVWTGGTVIFQFLVGLGVAVLFNAGLRGTRWVSSLVLIPWVTPGVIAAVIWKWMYHPLYGVLNEIMVLSHVLPAYKPWLADPHLALLSIVVAAIWKGFPFSMVMLLAGMKAIPQELYEAAEVDGASGLARFLHVTLPLLAPVFKITILLTTIWTFNYFDLVYAMTGGGPGRSTEILATQIYKLAFDDWRFGVASSLAVIMFAILAVFTLIYAWVLERKGEGL